MVCLCVYCYLWCFSDIRDVDVMRMWVFKTTKFMISFIQVRWSHLTHTTKKHVVFWFAQKNISIIYLTHRHNTNMHRGVNSHVSGNHDTDGQWYNISDTLCSRQKMITVKKAMIHEDIAVFMSSSSGCLTTYYLFVLFLSALFKIHMHLSSCVHDISGSVKCSCTHDTRLVNRNILYTFSLWM